MKGLYFDIIDKTGTNLVPRRNTDVEKTLLNLTLCLHRCIVVVITTCMKYCEMNSLVNFEATLAHFCEVIVLTLRKGCEFDVTFSTLHQLCKNHIHSTPWIKLTIQRWCVLNSKLCHQGFYNVAYWLSGVEQYCCCVCIFSQRLTLWAIVLHKHFLNKHLHAY